MYKTVFWFLLIWTIVSLFLYLRGYDVFTSLMLVLVLDIAALGIIVQKGKDGPLGSVNAEVSAKIDNLERVCQSILSSTGGDAVVQRIEENIAKQKDDVNYLLDKMSRKMLELEEKINKFGFSLAEHIEEKLDEKKYDETQNSFNVGETVYIDDYAEVEEDTDEEQQ
jgi:hypothetical protein